MKRKSCKITHKIRPSIIICAKFLVLFFSKLNVFIVSAENWEKKNIHRLFKIIVLPKFKVLLYSRTKRKIISHFRKSFTCRRDVHWSKSTIDGNWPEAMCWPENWKTDLKWGAYFGYYVITSNWSCHFFGSVVSISWKQTAGGSSSWAIFKFQFKSSRSRDTDLILFYIFCDWARSASISMNILEERIRSSLICSLCSRAVSHLEATILFSKCLVRFSIF